MMLGVRRVLHDGRLIHAGRRLGRGKVFGVSSLGSPCRLPNVILRAWCVVDAGTSVGVYHAVDVEALNFVFRVDKQLAKRSS